MLVILKQYAPVRLLMNLLLCVTIGVLSHHTLADNPPTYQLNYWVKLQPEKNRARVIVRVDRGAVLRHISFATSPRYSNFKANGKLVLKDGRYTWDLPEENARLSFTVKINHERDPGRYDALMTEDWAIFRGDNLIPAIHTDELPGAESIATIKFKLPKNWSIETAWPRKVGTTFRIDNPERRFDRPIGWMIAGKLGTRRTQVGNTNVAVSAPKGSDLRRMDALTFLTFVWPQLQKAFINTPDKLLIVGQGDPMWRGGLSGPNSMFLHADRPLVSENGTSPLVHELVHMVTRISGVKGNGYSDDWIAEGLAEFYSFELMFRAGAMSQDRRASVIKHLSTWGAEINYLRLPHSSGPVTARAVVLLDELDQEIRTHTKDKYSLDDVVRELITLRKVSLDDLRKHTEYFLGGKSQVLKSPLLIKINAQNTKTRKRQER